LYLAEFLNEKSWNWMIWQILDVVFLQRDSSGSARLEDNVEYVGASQQYLDMSEDANAVGRF